MDNSSRLLLYIGSVMALGAIAGVIPGMMLATMLGNLSVAFSFPFIGMTCAGSAFLVFLWVLPRLKL